jgi:hypothetical protein
MVLSFDNQNISFTGVADEAHHMDVKSVPLWEWCPHSDPYSE